MVAQPCFVLSSDRDEGSLTLADGSMLHVRPAQQADARALQRFYDGLSAGSRYQRFFGFLVVLTEERARTFTQLDTADGLALIALDPADPERIVAVVGYGREACTERADYAAAVADDWQGRGLGLALTRRLVAAARRRGVRELTAAMLPQNARMRGVFDALGLAMRGEWEDGFVRIDLFLGPIEQDDQPQHATAASD